MSTPVSIYDVFPPTDAPEKVAQVERAVTRYEIDIAALIGHRIRVSYGNVPWLPGTNKTRRAAGYTFSARHYRFRHMPKAMKADGTTPDKRAREDPRPALVAYLLPHETFHTITPTDEQKVAFMNEMVPKPDFDPNDHQSIKAAWEDGPYLGRGQEVAADSFVAWAADVDRLEGGRYYERVIPNDRLFRVGEILVMPAQPAPVPLPPPAPTPLPPPEPIPEEPESPQVIELAPGQSIVVRAAQAALI